jgi:hypothetical protein
MIRPLVPLTYAEERICTFVMAGYTVEAMAAVLGIKPTSARLTIKKAAQKIGGPLWATDRLRCLIWKAMEVGVIQYLSGLRNDDGKLLAPPPMSPPVIVEIPQPESFMAR